jgi:hypothetical protein
VSELHAITRMTATRTSEEWTMGITETVRVCR